ncbi:MAG: DUF4388 domain-containing protein [Deltaproteobacteria bacterium]|nr:DUF4388 domain-containing protein [Deltaproteobacteria bacterium]
MSPADASKKQYLLKFISGKYQGGEFPVAADREIVIGRSNELDVVLVEDMVSRRHAKITFSNDALTIEDLGSTNGTFVNGEKVKRAKLKEGDRVLIGTSIVRVALTDAVAGSGESREAEARARMQSAAQRTSNVKTMSGTIDEVPLVDLLQLFATSKKSGVLVITRDPYVGKVFLRKGQLAYASINDSAEIGALKAVYRMLAWDTGFFELQPPDEREFDQEIDLSTEGILMEGMRQLDESRRLLSTLPPINARLGLAIPLQPPLKDLDERELSVLQAVINTGRIEAALDRVSYTDLEVCEVMSKLVSKGYLRVEP